MVPRRDPRVCNSGARVAGRWSLRHTSFIPLSVFFKIDYKLPQGVECFNRDTLTCCASSRDHIRLSFSMLQVLVAGEDVVSLRIGLPRSVA